MADFDPSIAPQVLAACQAGAAEAAGAMGRSLDGTIQLTVGEATTFDPAAMPEELQGPGLAILNIVGAQGAVALIAESSGILPAWYGAPDATGTSKLATLAQELGMLLLPEEFMPDDFRAAQVPHLGQAIERAGAAAGAGMVTLTMKAGDKQGLLYLLWPLAAPSELYKAPAAEPAPAAAAPAPAPAPVVEKAAPVAPPAAAPPAPKAPVSPAIGYEQLPAYTRSLLRIRVPVVVTLANKKQPLKKITELRPGSIIQFSKSCEEMLELEVNDQVIAEGECVKAGDKFGLRITAMKPAEERFKTVRKARA
jgi:flagellar motor switch protein FliN/FliY